jgi:hypothetical protein
LALAVSLSVGCSGTPKTADGTKPVGGTWLSGLFQKEDLPEGEESAELAEAEGESDAEERIENAQRQLAAANASKASDPTKPAAPAPLVLAPKTTTPVAQTAPSSRKPQVSDSPAPTQTAGASIAAASPKPEVAVEAKPTQQLAGQYPTTTDQPEATQPASEPDTPTVAAAPKASEASPLGPKAKVVTIPAASVAENAGAETTAPMPAEVEPSAAQLAEAKAEAPLPEEEDFARFPSQRRTLTETAQNAVDRMPVRPVARVASASRTRPLPPVVAAATAEKPAESKPEAALAQAAESDSPKLPDPAAESLAPDPNVPAVAAKPEADAPVASEQDIARHIASVAALLKQSRQSYAEIEHYEAHLICKTRQENDELKVLDLAFRYRRDPEAMQVGWDPDPALGTQWLYAPTEHPDTVVMREETRFGTLKTQVPLDDEAVLDVHRRPLNRWGIGAMLADLDKALEDQPSGKAEIRYEGLRRINEASPLMHRVAVKDTTTGVTYVYLFDRQTVLPVYLQEVDANGEWRHSAHYDKLDTELKHLEGRVAFELDTAPKDGKTLRR